MSTREQAKDMIHVWKSEEARRFAVSFVKHALESGLPMFTTDLVPDEDRGFSAAIPGTVASSLEAAHVIESVIVGSDLTGFCQMTAKTKRKAGKGRKLGVWKLYGNGSNARVWLNRNGVHLDRQVQTVMDGVA